MIPDASVTSLGELRLGEGPVKIIVPIMPRRLAEVARLAATLAEQPLHAVEWRVDHLEDVSEALTVARELRESLGPVPLLATYRTSREGGLGQLDDAAYADLVLDLARCGLVDGVDVEYLRAPEQVARAIDGAHLLGVKVLGSFHDFDATPPLETLLAHLEGIRDVGADVVKVAVTPNTPADVATVLLATARAVEDGLNRPVLSVAMGPLGLASRVAGGAFGSCATFASVGAASAPGQIPLEELAPLASVFPVETPRVTQPVRRSRAEPAPR